MSPDLPVLPSGADPGQPQCHRDGADGPYRGHGRVGRGGNLYRAGRAHRLARGVDVRRHDQAIGAGDAAHGQRSLRSDALYGADGKPTASGGGITAARSGA